MPLVAGQAVVLALLVKFIAHLIWRHAVGNMRDKIRAADDMTAELVDVPEWDVKIEVRSMTAKARAKMMRECLDEDNVLDFEVLYPAILVACCFDPEDGSQVFEATDVAWLEDKGAGPMERIAQVGMRLSGLSQEALEAGKAAS